MTSRGDIVDVYNVLQELLSPDDYDQIVESAQKTMVPPLDEAVTREKTTYEDFAQQLAKQCGFPYAPFIDGDVLSTDNILITTTVGKYSWFPPYVSHNEGVMVVAKNQFNLRIQKMAGPEDQTNRDIVNLYEQLLDAALKCNATDIHLDFEENASVVKVRVDGELRRARELTSDEGAAVGNYILMQCNRTSNVKFDLTKMPQDGRLTYGDVNLRVGFLPTRYGYKVTLRVLKRNTTTDSFDSLGFLPTSTRYMTTMMKKTYGLIIVTGPTNSGKSRTIASCLKTIDRDKRHVLTVEDPIEYPVYGANQSQVHLWKEQDKVVGYDFHVASRAFLRHDPDVVLIGETRDKVTADTMLEMATTGHLVLTTLHANSTAFAPQRLLVWPLLVDPFSLASSLLMITSQRLVKLLCPKCRITSEVTREHLNNYYVTRTTPFDEFIGRNVFTSHPGGCDACNKSGYNGRTVIEEVMIVDDRVREIIIAHNGNPELLKKCVDQSFTQTIISKVLEGVIDLFQVLEVLSI